MDAEKKRKKGEIEEVDGGGGRRKKEREVAVAAGPPPTEEEVEEFFAILRRMRVAVNYFQSNGDGRKLTDGWATTVETTEVLGAVGEDAKAEEKSVDGAEENGVLDLNAIPEAETNSD